MKRIVFVLPLLAWLAACSTSSERKFVKSPVDTLIRDLDKEQNFSIILYDMEMKDDDTFTHRYKVITQKDSLPSERLTDWMPVGEEFFLENENNMGMEIASKTDGVVSKIPAPPGYNNYVGNEKYGQWRTGNDGTSFWEFYGQYAFMSNMLGLAGSLINRNGYYDYRNNYLGRAPYYGALPSGQPMYGTYSDHGRRANPSFHTRPGGGTAFKSRVQDRVSRSSSSGRSRNGSGSSVERSRRSSGSSGSSSRRSFGGGGRRRR